MEIVYDEDFDTALSDLAKSGGQAPLHDLTDWGWDRVSIFFEGDEVSFVKAEVGTSLGYLTDGSSKYLDVRGNLIVFQMDGKATKLLISNNLWIRTGYPSDGRRSYTGDVIVIANPNTHTNCILTDDDSPT